jgi:hypothetical protein
MIIVGEATPGPPQDGNAELAEIIDSRFAVAVDIRNRRLLSDPETTIHARPEMFRELSVQLWTHDADRIARVDRDTFGFRRRN